MIITLTTDFGIEDGYVGVMKGVMAGIAPGVPMIDLSHAIPPQDVHATAYLLWTVLPYLPPDSVHLVVVDPGVGTSRRPIASRTPWGTLVGPDNGVFSYVWEAAPPERTVALRNPDYQRPGISQTFHGRDIFSPAAAYLAQGVPLHKFGPDVTDVVRLPSPTFHVAERQIQGEVLYIDHFGNVISSIGRLVWEGQMLHLDPAFGQGGRATMHATRARVLVGDHDLGPIRRTYGEVPHGQALALVGSEGMLELAVNQRNGAKILGLNIGDQVTVVFE